MTAIELKKELKALIDQEADTGILEAIKTLLKRTSREEEWKEKLTSRALKSREDIKAGRLLSREEVEEQTDDLV